MYANWTELCPLLFAFVVSIVVVVVDDFLLSTPFIPRGKFRAALRGRGYSSRKSSATHS